MKEGPHMDKDEQLRRLLRLKRYEQPPEGFAEEFLEKFQRRQRSEIIRRSSLSILWERTQAWLDGLRRPAVIWSAAGAYAAVMLTLWLLPRPAPSNGSTIVIGGAVVTAPPVDYQPNGSHNITSQHADTPGKRRTITQEQDKQPVIGPEEQEEKQGQKPAPKLRDL